MRFERTKLQSISLKIVPATLCKLNLYFALNVCVEVYDPFEKIVLVLLEYSQNVII